MQKIIPAILTNDPNELQEKLALLRGHTKWVHIDIADGKFVPNTTIALFDLQEADQFFNLEIHLMVAEPVKYFQDCEGIGAKRVMFHSEAAAEVMNHVLDEGEKYAFQKGIALNPGTRTEIAAPYLEKLDSVLVMGVEPGFQGRPFVPETFERVQQMKKYPHCPLLGIDGGIGKENIQQAFASGIDYAVVGSSIFETEDPLAAFANLQKLIE